MCGVKSVFIEISGKCNANCPYCAQVRIKKNNHCGGNTSPIFFKKIIDHLFTIGIIDKKDLPHINLYNWGEPFLNSNINDILQILKNNNLRAGISSNFIKLPDINKELLSVLNNVTFSLSGYSQSSYGKIHGATLKKVIANFETFCEDVKTHSPKTKIMIYWHRYLFNEHEFWSMHKKLNRHGISFGSVIAYLNDGIVMKRFLKDELSEDYIKRVKKDIFLDVIKKDVSNHKKKSKNYRCPQWDSIVIDESGQLLLCCCVTKYDYDCVLGEVCNMSSEEIWEKKLNHSFCDECISLGIARFVHNPNSSLPNGKGLYILKQKFYLNFRKNIGQILEKLPYGKNVISRLS